MFVDGQRGKTVRYYERVRLVVPETRSTGNYRVYGDESLKKLMFIRAALAIGFTLEDIKSLLATGSGWFLLLRG